MALSKQDRKLRIKRRIRKVVNGTAERPRLSVFRSNANITAQLVDDTKAITIASASTQLKEIAGEKGTKSEKAGLVGKKIAELALAKGIDKVVFDRNGLLYHGRIKSLAEAAREAGLKF